MQAPPQYSPDGRYWWNGREWVPVQDQTARAGRNQARVVALVVVGVVVLGCGGVCTGALLVARPPASHSTATVSPRATPTSTSANVCSSDPRAHVYHPDRLKLLAPCVTVTGTIDLIQPQPDGDFHIWLRLDNGQSCSGQPCANKENVARLQGDLLLEPVCENTVTQADAVEACKGYHNPLAVPSVGTRAAATGPFVLDLDHGWNEIHPLESLVVVSASPSPSPSAAPSSSPAATPSQPQPAFGVTITASTYGHVAATTSPGAVCRAQAKLPSGRISTASALQVAETADIDGAVSWTYGTTSRTTAGTGVHTVTCTYQSKTATAAAPFTVS